MKVVVVGNGGREEALCWALRRGGATVVAIAASGSVAQLAATALAEEPQLVVIGPEAPLVAGLADLLRAEGVPVFGPSRHAAQLEGSKAYSKAFMRRHGVPTADYRTFTDLGAALEYLATQTAPVVIKDSGLAAGKGVTVAMTLPEAEAALRSLFASRRPNTEVVVEEFLTGRELTVMLFTDGRDHRLLPLARDHKRLLDGDQGAMTGGMGAVAPVALSEPGLLELIEQTIVAPVLAGIAAEDMLYRGVLYVGIMLTPAGPRVLEFNVRFGDPEAQAVLPLLASNAPQLFLAVAEGRLGEADVSWDAAHTVCVVMAAPGYPDAPVAGVKVRPPAELPAGVHVFKGGLQADQTPGVFTTSGGRVLSVVAVAPTAEEARAAAYECVAATSFPGAQFRTDIGS